MKYAEARNQNVRHLFHAQCNMARCLETKFRLGVCIERKYTKRTRPNNTRFQHQMFVGLPTTKITIRY